MMSPTFNTLQSAQTGDYQASDSTNRTIDRPRQETQLPTIAVVMPVRNEEGFIARAVEGLLQQDYPMDRFQILVVDGRSTDRTREIAAQYATRHAQVRLLDNPQRLSSAARNIGVRQSHAEIVLIVDGHCEITDRGHLRKLADAFARSGADCIGRPQPLDVTGATTLQRAIAAARSSRLGHHPSSFIYCTGEQFAPAHSVAVAYRRHVFERIGYFDEHFDACEDVEFNHRVDRAGLKCFFTPEVAVRYVPRSTLPGLARQLARYGKGRMRLSRKHRDARSLTSFLPALLLGGLLLGGLMALMGPSWMRVAYTAMLSVYIAAVVVNSASIAFAGRSAMLLVQLPLVFLAIHFSCGFGAIAELLLPIRGGPRFTPTAENTPACNAIERRVKDEC